MQPQRNVICCNAHLDGQQMQAASTQPNNISIAKATSATVTGWGSYCKQELEHAQSRQLTSYPAGLGTGTSRVLSLDSLACESSSISNESISLANELLVLLN